MPLLWCVLFSLRLLLFGTIILHTIQRRGTPRSSSPKLSCNRATWTSGNDGAGGRSRLGHLHIPRKFTYQQRRDVHRHNPSQEDKKAGDRPGLVWMRRQSEEHEAGLGLRPCIAFQYVSPSRCEQWLSLCSVFNNRCGISRGRRRRMLRRRSRRQRRS